MHKENHLYVYWLVIFVSMFLFVFPEPGIAEPGIADPGFKTAVIVSRKIRPYLQVVDGITQNLTRGLNQIDVFFLSPQKSQDDNQANTRVTTQVKEGQYDLVAAIGPEAVILLWAIKISSKKFYAAVLNPHSIPEVSADACGISLRIPIQIQLEKIARTFQGIKKIGLIFDPRHNKWFYDQAVMNAKDQAVDIIPLQVTSRNQIASLLKKNKGKIDVIWMIPDQTVISEKIIHYVVKQGIYNQMGVIGYNSFFTSSGAFFSFEFDYELLGKQAGEAILKYFETGECREDSPVFNAVINQKVADKIGIRVTK